MELSPTQRRVMEWMSKGWSAEQQGTGGVYINGQRACNTDTMIALYRRGLVDREKGQWTWKATKQGLDLSL